MSSNLFHDIAAQLPEEQFTQLVASPHVRIERIVSTGQCSPPDFWYDQAEQEWVIVLQGCAELEFDDGSIVPLSRGDYLLIQVHRRHRVRSTTPDEPTIWLAVFFSG